MNINDIKELVDGSDQFTDEDMEMLLLGMQMANSFIVPVSEAENDPEKTYLDGKITEFEFVANIVDNKMPDPKYITLVDKETFLVVDVGNDHSVQCEQDIDRFTGFQAVAVADALCKMKVSMEEDHVDFVMLTSHDVDNYSGPYSTLDVFQPPRLKTSVDDDVIAIQKKVYRSLLNKMVTEDDKLIYIGGDFGAASLRKYNYPIDCVFFNEVPYYKSIEDRKINHTDGEDFLIDISDVERLKELLSGYTLILHNFLFGEVYKILLTLDLTKITLVAMGLEVDKEDKDIYKPGKKICRYLEEYSIDSQSAEKFKMQILYDAEDYYIVYMDHGRYVDYKPYDYEVMIPFYELDTWEINRYYQVYNHFCVFMSGPKSIHYKISYSIPDGPIRTSEVINGVVNIGGYDILIRNLNGRLLSYSNNQIFDVSMNAPYWQRRMYLVNAGVVFNTYVGSSRIITNMCKFKEFITAGEVCFHEYVKEKHVKPYIELRNIGLNPLIKSLVYDSRAISHIFYNFQGGKIPVGALRVTLREDGSIILDDLGDFYLITTLSFSRKLYLKIEADEVISDFGDIGIDLD